MTECDSYACLVLSNLLRASSLSFLYLGMFLPCISILIPVFILEFEAF